MENAADALKIAFAIFVFILAISITFSIISKAKSTADHVLYYTDKTNFYDHTNSKTENRKVSLAEVISTLYRYDKESLAVTLKIEDETYVFDLANSNNDKKILDYLRENGINEPGNKITNPEDVVGKFINIMFLSNSEIVNPTFQEEFVETSIDGKYVEIKHEDNSTERLLQTSDSKKVYVTYTYEE